VKAVNLLPREELSGRRSGGLDPLVLGGVVLLVAVVGGTAGGFVLEHKRASSEQQQLSAAQTRLATAQARMQHEQSHTKKSLPTPSVTSQEQPWRTAIASAMSTRIAFDHVLQEFERVVPSDITLTQLTMNSPNAASSSPTTTVGGATTGGSFILTGSTFSEDSVARLLSRLMLVPDLSGVSLQSSTADPQSGIVTFSIQAQVKGAAAPASSTPPADTTGTTTTTGGSAA
jgi:Tfp pilus assembly protein PilN